KADLTFFFFIVKVLWIQPVFDIFYFGLTMRHWNPIFIQTYHDDFIYSDNGFTGHFVPHFTSQGYGSSTKINHIQTYFDNISFFSRTFEVNFTDKFGYRLRIFELDDGI